MASENMINARTKFAINKWGKRISATESVLGPMSMEKKAALAVSLSNTQNLLEATQPKLAF
jgi:hypothetical protein